MLSHFIATSSHSWLPLLWSIMKFSVNAAWLGEAMHASRSTYRCSTPPSPQSVVTFHPSSVGKSSSVVWEVWDLFYLLLFQKDLEELFLLTGLQCGLSLLLCGLVHLYCVTVLDISRDNKCFTLLWCLSLWSFLDPTTTLNLFRHLYPHQLVLLLKLAYYTRNGLIY